MASLFERLNKRQPQQVKKTTERRPKNADFVAQGEKDAKIKSFLLDILAKRPVAATAIEKRGAEAGFSRKQLWRGKQLLGIISFKKEFGFEGRWYSARAQHDPKMIKPGRRFTSRLRNLSRSLGYRLQPIGRKGGGKPDKIS
jgi:hypothetical protein